MEGIPAGCIKAFVQRDYSDGMTVKFEKSLPRELEGKISREQFEETIDRLNTIYREAEQLSCSSFCEGCFACLTSYIFLCCMKTHYEKKTKEGAEFLDQQNREIYRPRGILVIDPMLRGLRVLEFILLNTGDNSVTL